LFFSLCGPRQRNIRNPRPKHAGCNAARDLLTRKELLALWIQTANQAVKTATFFRLFF
jgi:hypothetical protein